MSETVLRYRYRAYPDKEADSALSRTFGSGRVVFNDVIAAREHVHKNGLAFPKTSELSRKLITGAKHHPERQWLSEVSAVALQQSLRDADAAYKNFFRSIKAMRRGRKVGHPKLRSKNDSRQTARFTANARFKVTEIHERRALLTLPKIGDIPFVLSRPLPSDPTSVTVIREADGRVCLSFVVRVLDSATPTTGRACGIDVGLSNFANLVSVDTTMGGITDQTICNQRFLRRKARALARSQRSLSRKKMDSANRAKQKMKVARLHRKVRESRLDHAHQQAARVIATHGVICIEDLAVAGMARTNLSRSVADTAMSQFLRLLDENAQRQGKRLVEIGRFFSSTQMCSSSKDLTGPKGLAGLKVRQWTCYTCCASHERDTNAARNILTRGLHMLNVEQTSLVADGRSETENACRADIIPAVMMAASAEAGRVNEDSILCQV